VGGVWTYLRFICDLYAHAFETVRHRVTALGFKECRSLETAGNRLISGHDVGLNTVLNIFIYKLL